MTRKKQPPEVSIVRSSAAEYLTFVAATGSQQQAVEMRYEDENLWLSQKMMATLYDVTVPAISQHLKRIFTLRRALAEQLRLGDHPIEVALEEPVLHVRVEVPQVEREHLVQQLVSPGVVTRINAVPRFDEELRGQVTAVRDEIVIFW